MIREANDPKPRTLTLKVGEGCQTSGLFLMPDAAVACYVFAHGAGAGMHHHSMNETAEGLFRRGVATLRYQFPFMEAGSRRPDPPALAHAAVRAAAGSAAGLAPDLPLFAGGRSFGGRMTSQAQAEAPLPGVQGLAFLGFPLHPAKKPSVARADHLARVKIPMLFVQGDRDALAELKLLRPVVQDLGADLHVVEGGDHSFRVPARLHRTDAQVMDHILDRVRAWMLAIARE